MKTYLAVFFLSMFIMTKSNANGLADIDKYNEQFEEFCKIFEGICNENLISFSSFYANKLRNNIKITKEISQEIKTLLEQEKLRKERQRKLKEKKMKEQLLNQMKSFIF